MRTIYIFDVDDTLINTQACVIARDRQGREVFRVGTQTFNRPDSAERLLSPGLTWDFSEFESLEQLFNEPVLPPFKTLSTIRDCKDVHIITARQCKSALYDWLHENFIGIRYNNIHCYDASKYEKVSDFKAATVKVIYQKAQEKVEWHIYEDDEENLNAMCDMISSLK
jgi:hypothetical protein